MDFIKKITEGLSTLIVSNTYKDLQPFLLEETKIVISSGKEAIGILLDARLSAEEKKKLYEQWIGQFKIFTETLKREGSYLAEDLLAILAQSAFEDLTSLLGFK